MTNSIIHLDRSNNLLVRGDESPDHFFILYVLEGWSKRKSNKVVDIVIPGYSARWSCPLPLPFRGTLSRARWFRPSPCLD